MQSAPLHSDSFYSISSAVGSTASQPHLVHLPVQVSAISVLFQTFQLTCISRVSPGFCKNHPLTRIEYSITRITVVKSDYKASLLLFWSDEFLSLAKWAWYSTVARWCAYSRYNYIAIRALHMHACSNLLFVMECELGECSVSGDYGDCLKLLWQWHYFNLICQCM